MMPKSWTSHAGLVRLCAVVMMGAALCCPAYTQMIPPDTAENDVNEEAAFGLELVLLRNFRATPTFVDDDSEIETPVVVLTWDNPPRDIISLIEDLLPTGIYQLTLYKSAKGYPTGPLDGQRISLAPRDDAYLDREVLDGTTYYYTLIGEFPTLEDLPDSYLDDDLQALIDEFPQVRHASVTAGAGRPNILTESMGQDPLLGEQEPFDLANSQITIRPVGPPLAELGEPIKYASYDTYEATITHHISDLPVKRNDQEGGAYTLTPMRGDRLAKLTLGDMRFPFFGKEYDTLYLGVNGYIVFQDILGGLDPNIAAYVDLTGSDEEEYDLIDILNMPNVIGHFAVPRISFLFSMLDFQTGGEAWARMLSDRVVITFERATEWFYNPYVDSVRNTVQVELFFNGKIRMTYLDAFVNLGIVGISDGRGLPVDPTEVFDNVEPVYLMTDFSFLPEHPSRLSINPVAPPVVLFDEDATFTAYALVPGGMSLPFFTGEWSNDGNVPFTDIGGAGKFIWKTTYEDRGAHTVRVIAQSDGMRAYQDVRVIVKDALIKPTAIELLLSTNTENEDPSVSRPISAERPLIASYTYYHPYQKQSPLIYEELFSIIYWYRNDQVVTSFTNSRRVPSHIPQPGDKWRFQIIPITVMGVQGPPANSPVVTVLATPQIDAVYPSQGLTIGGDTVVIRGRNLANPLSVSFGDASIIGVSVIDNNEISVVTPMHPAGKVTVSVETPGGIGRRIDAFTFVGDKDDEEPPDDNDEKRRVILGCGGGNTHPAPGGHAGSFLLAALVALVLARAARRQNIS